MNKTEAALSTARTQLQGTERDLADAARWLADRMTKLAEGLTADAANTSTNSLGEVQSLGDTVDRLCAVRSQQLATVQMLEWVVASDEEA
jgi:hypothetical protein